MEIQIQIQIQTQNTDTNTNTIKKTNQRQNITSMPPRRVHVGQAWIVVHAIFQSIHAMHSFHHYLLFLINFF